MKKFLLLFLTLTCAAVAQVKIDIGDIDWPNRSASQLFRRNVANNGFEFFTASPQLTLTGDASGTTTFTNLGNGSLALTLANSGVTANTYGSATQVPSFTVDAKGRITGVSLITATPAWGSVTGKPTAVDGSTTQSANRFYAGPVSGSAAAPAFRALVQADTQAATAATRNVLAPRPGVVLDGASGARIFGALTNQNIGPDSFALVLGYQVAPAIHSNSRGVVYIGSNSVTSNTATTFMVEVKTAGEMVVLLTGSTTSDWRKLTFNGFVPAFAGKDVQLAFIRDAAAGTMTVMVNGAALTGGVETTAGTPPAWSGSITSSFLVLGNNAGSEVHQGRFTFASLYNFAITSADVQEIYEAGGAVPYRYQFGSQIDLINSATLNGGFESLGAGGGDTFATWTEAPSGSSTITDDTSTMNAGAHAAILTNNGGTAQVYQNIGLKLGKAYQVSAFAKTSNGGTLRLWVGGSGSGGFTTQALTGTWTKYTFVQVNPAAGNAFFYIQNDTASSAITVDDVRVNQVGAVLHLPFNDQLGLQARDASTNALHAERTSTGTAWTDPRQSGRQTLTYTFAHSAISSTAATTTAFVLPPNTVLREVQLNRTAAFDGGTMLDVGISGTPTKFVNATSVAGTGFTQVASSSLVPESASATTTVFVKKNQATTTGSVTLNFIIEAVGSPTQ